MRLANAEHESGPWRIREIASDFELEDVWAIPAQGDAEDFRRLVEMFTSSDPTASRSRPTRALWRLRARLGGLLDRLPTATAASGGSGETSERLPIPGTSDGSLAERLPADLRGTAAGIEFASLPFEPLYRTDTEFAAEASNQTVHAVMHLAWVDGGDGGYHGQMAVYVKPRGLLGRGYMAAIKPFRHWIVYPALMRQTERAWNATIDSNRRR